MQQVWRIDGDGEEDRDEDVERAVEELAATVAIERFAAKRDVEELSIEELRSQLQAREQPTQGVKKTLVGRLWAICEVEESTHTMGDATVKMNLHRLKQLTLHLMLRWDGLALGWGDGGGEVRRKVVELVLKRAELRDRFAASYVARAAAEGRAVAELPEWTEARAIGAAADQSSYFAGLWVFFESEVRLATVPYQDWVEGDALAFLKFFPAIVLQVCAAPKPQVRKFMLAQLDKFLHYREHHPDFFGFLSRNAKRIDEEDIELTNALLGRFFHARQVATVDTYIYISGLITGLHRLSKQLDSLALRTRRAQASEHVRMRGLYATSAWEETNAAVDGFIIGRVEAALGQDDAAKVLNDAWPREDRLRVAGSDMGKYNRQMQSWLATHRRRDPAAAAPDDESTDDEAPAVPGTAAMSPAVFAAFLKDTRTYREVQRMLSKVFKLPATGSADALRERVAERVFADVNPFV